MSVGTGLVIAVAALQGAIEFQCDLMSYVGSASPKVSTATLKLENRGDRTDVTLVTEGVQELSGRHRGVGAFKDAQGINRSWPVSMKADAGGRIKLDLIQTQSTHEGVTAALLITEGGDFVVANLVENDERFIAAGMCSIKQDVPK